MYLPVQEWLREGADPSVLARSSGAGFALGTCPLPIPFLTTLLALGGLAAARFCSLETHPAMALLANLLAVPAQVRRGAAARRLGHVAASSCGGRS